MIKNKPIFSYTCSGCGELHEGAPSFSWNEPLNYHCLSDEDKEKAKLSEDLCVINDGGFFVRGVIEVPIIDFDDPFMWGVWVSQSEENFNFYAEHFDEDLLGRETFGWLSTQLPIYEDTVNLKTIVQFQNENMRPKIYIQECDHQLSHDFHNGITSEKAIEMANEIMHRK